MKHLISKYKDSVVTLGCFSSEGITSLTKAVHFSSNTISRAMDTANGGVLRHGGFHRIFGGHSIMDYEMLSKYGPKYFVEIGKDSLTPNGIPIPGVETLVNKGLLSAGVAQKWGSMAIGNIAAAGIAGIDTAINLRRLLKQDEEVDLNPRSLGLKGTAKVIIGAGSGNAPLMVFGACDLTISLYSVLESQIQIDVSDLLYQQLVAD